MRTQKPGLRAGFPKWRTVSETTTNGVIERAMECPSCLNETKVNRLAWVVSSELKTRACTYCFKAASIEDLIL